MVMIKTNEKNIQY